MAPKFDIHRSHYGILESFPGFSMAIILDFLHMGILLLMKHLLSISRNELLDQGLDTSAMIIAMSFSGTPA